LNVFLNSRSTTTHIFPISIGNLITSQGPGTALMFALELGQQLYGKKKREEIAAQMLVK
jgi:hypothetical protein